MKTEQQMMELILGFARENDLIRAVELNGSRANPNAPRDPFQDYDIVYYVTDVDYFVRDRSWINRFGELMIIQTPDEMELLPPDGDGSSFGFLMQFADGNRIDLAYCPIDQINNPDRDSLSILVLDKDGLAQPLPPASDRDFVTRPPSAKHFSDCCNEFWWVSLNIAKGLWRRELSYAKFMYDGPVRDMLIVMIKWHIGVATHFSVDSGKYGKYFEKYLEPDLWEQFMQTYPDGNYDNIWRSLFVTGELFRKTATGVAAHFGFEYPYDDDRRVTEYLKHVQSLPRDVS